MGLFINAYNFMMENEDSTRACAIIEDAPNIYQTDAYGNLVLDAFGNKIRIGAYAISGINSESFPTQYAAIAAIPQGQREPAIQQFYQTTFWNQWFSQLVSDNLTMRVFDSAVNMGNITAIKLLQCAVNSLIPNSLVEDGIIGPNTVSIANKTSSPDTNIVAAFKTARVAYYNDIVANNPADAKYLPAWTARAQK